MLLWPLFQSRDLETANILKQLEIISKSQGEIFPIGWAHLTLQYFISLQNQVLLSLSDYLILCLLCCMMFLPILLFLSVGCLVFAISDFITASIMQCAILMIFSIQKNLDPVFSSHRKRTVKNHLGRGFFSYLPVKIISRFKILCNRK